MYPRRGAAVPPPHRCLPWVHLHPHQQCRHQDPGLPAESRPPQTDAL